MKNKPLKIGIISTIAFTLALLENYSSFWSHIQMTIAMKGRIDLNLAIFILGKLALVTAIICTPATIFLILNKPKHAYISFGIMLTLYMAFGMGFPIFPLVLFIALGYFVFCKARDLYYYLRADTDQP